MDPTIRAKWAAAMRQDWDNRASADALYYSTWKVGQKWNEEEFFGSGIRDYMLFVEPIIDSLGLDPEASDMLELGCGVGRMTRILCHHFKHIYATDVSPEMISKAKSYMPKDTNVTWCLSDGFEIPSIRNNSLDFAFSFLVFQHIPDKEIILANVKEILRTLKPGGIFLFQYNGQTNPITGWRERVIWGILDKWRIPLIPTLFRIDTMEAGKTWNGSPLTSDEVKRVISREGGRVVGTRGVDTPAAWSWGFKETS